MNLTKVYANVRLPKTDLKGAVQRAFNQDLPQGATEEGDYFIFPKDYFQTTSVEGTIKEINRERGMRPSGDGQSCQIWERPDSYVVRMEFPREYDELS